MATPEELKALDEAINAIRESLPSLKASLKGKQTSLAGIRAAPTTDVLRAEVDSSDRDNKEMEERLSVLRSGNIKPVSTQEKEDVEKMFKEWTRKKNIRRGIFAELEGMILDSGGIGKEELWVG